MTKSPISSSLTAPLSSTGNSEMVPKTMLYAKMMSVALIKSCLAVVS